MTANQTAGAGSARNDLVIQTDGLTKYFGEKCAVDQLTMAVPRGSVLALLGRNGSGKSTLIRMILGLLEPTRGSARVLGEDCTRLTPATRGRIGYVAEGHPLIDWMRVGELEKFQKSFYSGWDGQLFKAVIEHFDLSVKSRAGNLSRGQRAGVSLALALAARPELLIMDDPALGLDPVARRSLLEAMILVTRDSGHTIFFSSHVLDDVERVADHVAIIDRSILRVCCPVETLQNRVRKLTLGFAGAPPPLPKIAGLLEARRESNELHLTIANFPAHDGPPPSLPGVISTTESPLSLAEIVLAYLGKRGEAGSLLGEIANTGALT